MSIEHSTDRLSGAIATGPQISVAVAGIGAVCSVVTGWLIAGWAGALAGAVIVAAWLVVAPIIVVALGQVLVAALVPIEAPFTTLAIAEAPLVLVFLGSILEERALLRTAWQGLLVLVVLSMVVIGGRAMLDTLWETAALLVGGVAVTGYGLHRYTVAALEVSK